MVDIRGMATCGELQRAAAERQLKVAQDIKKKGLKTVVEVIEAVRGLDYPAVVSVVREHDYDDAEYSAGAVVPLCINYRWNQQLAGPANSMGEYVTEEDVHAGQVLARTKGKLYEWCDED